jgi:hypothetical protein
VCHPLPPDTNWYYLAKAKNNFCSWVCYVVPLGAKQFIGKEEDYALVEVMSY